MQEELMRPSKNNTFLRIIKLPLRALCKARDLYVRGMGSCAARIGHGDSGCPGALPRSFSTGSDDFRELLRAASIRSLQGGDPFDVEVLLVRLNSGDKPRPMMRKSCRVMMGRIDEENVCEFGEGGDYGEDSKPGELKLCARRRSRSCADAASMGTYGI